MLLRMVTSRKRAYKVRFVHYVDSHLRGRVASAAVMVAAHQHAMDGTMALTPLRQRVKNAGGAGLCSVQKIAQENYFFSLVLVYQAAKALQVFVRGTAGHGLA
jgi:hypothetical protein